MSKEKTDMLMVQHLTVRKKTKEAISKLKEATIKFRKASQSMEEVSLMIEKELNSSN